MCMHLTVFLIVSLGGASEPAPTVVDRVEVVVGERFITTSDVRLETALNQRIPSTVLALRLQAADPRQLLIERAVIRGLAGQTSIYQPTDTDLQGCYRQLRDTFATPEDFDRFLRIHGLDKDSLSGRLYSRLVVERYVHRNIDLASQAAREDEATYYNRYLVWIGGLLSTTAIRPVAAQ